MQSPIVLIAYLAPIALILVTALAHVEPGRRPRRLLRAARAATMAALLLAAAAAALVATRGPLVSPLVGLGGVGFSVRLDALSAVMFCLVSFVGVVVVRFSLNYLDGDPRQGAFIGRLCAALAGVTTLVLSGSLLQLVAAWIAMSLAFHRLLIFYPDRPKAIVGARKKFVVARASDLCLAAAALLLAGAFGSGDLGVIAHAARAAHSPDGSGLATELAAVLVAVAAVLKSAQFPTHGWLLEVMETPTPVSALLHAGIVNAGGFLVVRFADVMGLGGPALPLLAAVGGFTALFGSVAMLAQTSVKVALTYSTVAQMGFMLFECGLGAFSFAMLHLVAHSLYKAHAFLSSASAVELPRARARTRTSKERDPRVVLGCAVVATATFAAVGLLLGVSPGHDPVAMGLGAILVLGLTHLLVESADDGRNELVLGKAWLSAAAVAAGYFLLESASTRLLADALPPGHPPDLPTLVLLAVAVGSFALLVLARPFVPSSGRGAWWAAAYVHARNGLYLNALSDHLVDALRRPHIEGPKETAS